MITSLYCFFKLLTCLPTAKEAGLLACTTEEANKTVEEVLTSQRSTCVRVNKKRSIQQVSPEIQAHIGRYAAENGNGAAVKSLRLHTMLRRVQCDRSKRSTWRR